MYTRLPYDKYQDDSADNAHKVIGQDYDNVIAVLDQHFYYDPTGKLDNKDLNHITIQQKCCSKQLREQEKNSVS